MKHVVSVSLGSSQRNRSVQTSFAGVPFCVERVGTDGDVRKAGELIASYDAKVDAIGLGGVDRYLVAGGRRYELRDAARMASNAEKTPVVDGSGIKLVLEPLLLRRLVEQGELEVEGKGVLLMSAVDRPGMAETFPSLGGKVVYGDLLYAVGVPIPLRTLRQVAAVAAIFLPVLCRLPMSVLYPTGKQQESTKTKHARYFEEADIIAGDFQFIRRYMPEDMNGKVVVTNTTRTGDVEELRKRGAAKLITMTPSFSGESFGANVMEGVLVALAEKQPEEMTEADYLRLAEEVNWRPGVTDLS
ncbi:MAG: quinate 5-dehydrogenase [Armatimonadota bacterium]|nr:MAG: quinate 5-dehydrogenase [Armatimonadota bacterium]